jgi:hypothetical protein
MTPIGNLPTIVQRPEIEDSAGINGMGCQAYTRDWIAGTGFVFETCTAAARLLISWSVTDRWRTRRQLRVCDVHGREFAERHGLAGMPGGSSSSADASVRKNQAHPRKKIPEDHADDPFADSDQPYERTREAGR